MSLSQEKLLFLDCQTTGMRPSSGHRLELAWAWGSDQDLASQTAESRLVSRPVGEPLPHRITQITGLRESDLLTSESTLSVWTSFHQDFLQFYSRDFQSTSPVQEASHPIGPYRTMNHMEQLRILKDSLQSGTFRAVFFTDIALEDVTEIEQAAQDTELTPQEISDKFARLFIRAAVEYRRSQLMTRLLNSKVRWQLGNDWQTLSFVEGKLAPEDAPAAPDRARREATLAL